MKKKYRSTFWSTETSNEWIQAFFVQGKSDDVKKYIVEYNSGKWEAIAPQVKEWIREGWMGWDRDKPVWFTVNWKAKVPADWVPIEGKEEWNRAIETVRGSKLGIMSLVSHQKLRGVQEDEDEILERDEEEASTGEAAAAAEVVRGGGRVQPVIR
jgi:hypothetical protein